VLYSIRRQFAFEKNQPFLTPKKYILNPNKRVFSQKLNIPIKNNILILYIDKGS
jgi:hypothetical protein